MLIIISDGVIHTGIDGVIDSEWDRDTVAEFLVSSNTPTMSAKSLATLLLNECKLRYRGLVMDDTTACVIKIKKRRQVNLVIGPPLGNKDAEKMIVPLLYKGGKD